jgi:hypothetical protein
MTTPQIKLDFSQKEFYRFCIYCKHKFETNICDRCLKWPRERPFWKLEKEGPLKKQKTRRLIGFNL